ncbi:MAG: transposase family protein [Bifidobacteriaceae bacterium]|nr:transposase family protein [Bifidobacteriaceae bacterium]
MASDLNGVLLDVSDPVPGRCHDAAAIGLNGRDRALEGADQIADTANTSAGAPTPTRKKPGPDLPECHREPDKQLSGLRCAVERRSAHLKNWKILTTGYRRQPKRLPDVIRLAVKHEKHRRGR